MATLGINNSSIAALSSATTLVGSLSNLLLATPNVENTMGYQPQNATPVTGLVSLLSPPPGLLFHYEGEQTTTFASDITDHFIESNVSIQDQIALKPVIVTTHGFIGELNNVPSNQGLGLGQLASNTLTAIGAFAPGLSTAATSAYNSASQAYQLGSSLSSSLISAVSSIGATNSGETVIGAIGSEIKPAANQNKQQTFFQQFYGYWQSRTLFTIQTPWAIFQSMAILSVRAIQAGEDRTVTDFEVSFKQMNFASLALSGTQMQTQGRLSAQSALAIGNGIISSNPALSLVKGLGNLVGSP